MRLSLQPRRPDAERSSQRGETLIEVLVALVLMGVGFAAVFSALYSAAKVAQLNERRTVAAMGLQSWAEGYQQPAATLTGRDSDVYYYETCTYPALEGQRRLPAGALPNSWRSDTTRVAVTKVRVLSNVAAGTWTTMANDGSNYDGCKASNLDKGMQEITLQVRPPAGSTPDIIETLVITRRNPKCPAVANYDNADLGPC